MLGVGVVVGVLFRFRCGCRCPVRPGLGVGVGLCSVRRGCMGYMMRYDVVARDMLGYEAVCGDAR